MIEEHSIGPGVDRAKISPDATIAGASYLTGADTAVGPGALVRDSRLHNAVIERSARVIDSIVIAEGEVGTHTCDAGGRTVVSGARPLVGHAAHVRGCTLINTSVGDRAVVEECWTRDCRLGAQSAFRQAKIVLVNTGASVQVTGPTELSEAWLGHHSVIDRRGYFEGIFSNSFFQLRYDEAAGHLKVSGVIDLPHVSRYGTGTVNSTNSGKLLPQSEGILKGFGPHVGLWHDALLSHEQVELGPCCWVAPRTKVVGQSGTRHQSDEDLVNDRLTTYLMPFALAGYGGDITRGLVMPGELSNGFGTKQRKGAWVFTYAPDLVLRMVKRLHDALEADRKAVADTIVAEALRTAIEMARAIAAHYRVDLAIPHDEQRPGWPRWIGATHALLTAHLEGGLWQFRSGLPVDWKLESGKWTHPRMAAVLAIAPDALDNQVRAEDVFGSEAPLPAARLAVPAESVAGTGGPPAVHPNAQVASDAQIGPGCRIGPGAVIGPAAILWNSIVEDSDIGAQADVARSAVHGSQIGSTAIVRSSTVRDSKLGKGTAADGAIIARSDLAVATTVSAFADLLDVRCEHATILGGPVSAADIRPHLMSMHMAGACAHLRADPMEVQLDGRRIPVPAIAMLGGGSLIRGTDDRQVVMQACFIGSNAVIEAGSRIGFGCCVLGDLGPDARLLPFTVSTGAEPRRRQIGGVLSAMPNIVITHFINWTFQAVGRALAPAVADMVLQAIRDGIEAIEWALARRAGQDAAPLAGWLVNYGDMSEYPEEQLQAALKTYQRALDSGAWQISFTNGELRFTSDKGRWTERNGTARWQPN